MAAQRTKAQEKVDEFPDVTPAERQQVVRAIDEMVPEIIGDTSSFDEDALRNAQSFDDFVELTRQTHGEVVEVGSVMGDGFTLIDADDKARLVGIPLLFMEWTFRDGDFGRPYVSVRVIARLPGGMMGRYIFNDGSTGIADQLAKYTKKTGKLGGLVVPMGLRESNYEVELPDGNGGAIMSPATTYYVDTSAS